MNNERILGLDLGSKTIGVAISDPFQIIAQGLKTIKRKNIDSDLEELKDIIEEYNIGKIVLGLPKNMNNTIGPSAQKAYSFKDILEKRLDIEVILEDERLSTLSAEKVLIEKNVRRENRKKDIDKIAATYILQVYLDRNNNG